MADNMSRTRTLILLYVFCSAHLRPALADEAWYNNIKYDLVTDKNIAVGSFAIVEKEDRSRVKAYFAAKNDLVGLSLADSNGALHGVLQISRQNIPFIRLYNNQNQITISFGEPFTGDADGGTFINLGKNNGAFIFNRLLIAVLKDGKNALSSIRYADEKHTIRTILSSGGAATGLVMSDKDQNYKWGAGVTPEGDAVKGSPKSLAADLYDIFSDILK